VDEGGVVEMTEEEKPPSGRDLVDVATGDKA
jgi:hypothetical protein